MNTLVKAISKFCNYPKILVYICTDIFCFESALVRISMADRSLWQEQMPLTLFFCLCTGIDTLKICIDFEKYL